MPDRSPPGAIISTMKLLHTLRNMVTRLELKDRHRPHEDDIYPLMLKPGTLVVADPNGEEHLFNGHAIINLDRSLTIIEWGEVTAYFPEGCFHVWNID